MRGLLFLCTGNSARSILAEAILAHRGGDRFAAFSAGSAPRGVPNPLALALLERKGLATAALRSKSWHEFARPGAPALHAVITVCDNAKGESCPVWPMRPGGARPVQAHWGIPDPAGRDHDGDPRDFERAFARLDQRIAALLALDEDALDPAAWRAALVRIGREGEGATG